ncbi:hypothetical protein C2S51_000870 [Perilla frutescens var. frutescens]|nr:hypothetical protein C2S51_000870 [Perilla frutescens var. frutescens]
MDSRGIIKKSSFSKKLSKTQMRIIISLTISAFLASLIINSSQDLFPHSRNHTLSFINKACSQTLYSSLCRSTLSATTSTIFLVILDFAIDQTLNYVKAGRITTVDHFIDQDLNARERNSLQDCMELLDQTLYELESAMDELASFPSSIPHLHRSYANIKTLLSAAMTNQYTCINGFLDLEQLHLAGRKGSTNTHFLQNLLTPVSHMISNSLALINQETVKKPKKKEEEVVDYVIMARQKRNAAVRNLRPNVIVACNGSGDYRIIGEAVTAAPNMSKKTYTIKINAGIYKENVVIPREKMNIMLVGDGMSSTIITGSRNLVDGFSTFESATLTVVGDKFMARDLTIENTAAPEKHQAVALRVTSNAAFYRCGIISHQDTLYAHSLRQLYHECTIQGTIDFIFGNAAAVFQNCTILVRRPMRGQRNTITAQGREDPYQNTGISLQGCNIKAAADFNPMKRKHFSTYLGRPWRNYSRAIVVNSYLGDLIHPRGWLEWAEYSSVETVDYIECMNYGPGAATRRRISWGGYRNNCTLETVKQFRVEEFLHGSDDWLESTVIPIFGAS